MKGYDIDGVMTSGVVPEPGSVVISGRTFAEYDDFAKEAASKFPLYIRGVGEFGDRHHAGCWKGHMIHVLGVTEFYEDDPYQADIIKEMNPNVVIHAVLPEEPQAVNGYPGYPCP